MKNLLTFLFMLIAFAATAQTPYSAMSLSDRAYGDYPMSADSERDAVASLANPWVGGKLAYNINGDVSQSFLLSARVLYTPYQTHNFALPIVGNVGLNNPDSTSKDDGVSIGMFPYYNIAANGNFQLYAHSGINYRFIDNADASQNEFRFLVGLEAALYPDNGGAPTTLSFAPELVLNNGLSKWGLGITGVLPITTSLGFLVEGGVPFDDLSQPTFSAGVIIYSQVK